MAAITVVWLGPAQAEPGDIFAVAAPAVGSPPPKAAALQDGDASVSTQTGALQYSYPITVPPGRHGMEPHLSLNYSSQGPIYGTIAAGWSLSIPIITMDTTNGRLNLPSGAKTYQSSMAGNRPLIPVTELAGPDPNDGFQVAQTYRAQNDTTYVRYERMDPQSNPTYKWRARAPDGTTYYFGNSADVQGCSIVSDEYAPLTREVDAFGNTVEYVYGSSIPGECTIGDIWWGHRSGQSYQADSFAHVAFSYKLSSPPACGGSPPTYPAIPVGSQMSYRSGTKIVTGASELDQITITAYEVGDGGKDPEYTRNIILAYDANAAACDAVHGAYRSLLSIHESASGTNSPLVNLPPVTFTYGDANLPIEYQQESPSTTPWQWPEQVGGDLDLRGNLGWGYRYNETKWPTVEATMLDIDGDGLVDRVIDYPKTVNGITRCGAEWEKNLGWNQSLGQFQFSLPSDQPWIPLPTLKWATPCSDSGASPWGGNQGCTYSAYDGGAYPNAAGSSPVAEGCALNYQVTRYVNSQSFPGTNDNCPAGDSCTADGYCASNGIDCADKGKPPAATYLAYRWMDVDGDGRVDLVASPTEGSLELYNLQIGNGVPGAETPVAEPQIFGQYGGSPDPNLPYRCPSVPNSGGIGTYTMCGSMFPWFIYLNHGNGVFGQSGSLPDKVLYQPVPLETANGDSSITGAPIGPTAGLLDIDGDGHPDGVGGTGNGSPWTVFRNDRSGQLLNNTPFTVSAGDLINTVGCAQPGSCLLLNTGGLFDFTGDGLLDHWTAGASYNNAAVEMNYGTGVVSDFPVGLRPANDGTPNAIVMSIPGAKGGSTFIEQGTRIDTSRTLDLDGDGRQDVYQSSLGQCSGSSQECETDFDCDTASGENCLGVGTAQTYLNEGGQFGGAQPNIGDAAALAHTILVNDLAGTYLWEVRSDMVDLDGDGIPEGVNFGTGYGYPAAMQLSHITTPTQPPRLLVKIDNGRGATTSVAYAPTAGSSVVTQHPDLTETMPHTQWVVHNLTTIDSVANTTTTTSYQYDGPQWLQDPDRGTYGFRGFAEVDTTLPSGAVRADRYSYSPDWSGRLAETLMYPGPVQQPLGISDVSAIDKTTWGSFSLFNNTITTFHPTLVEHWTCSNGQTENACFGDTNSYTRTVSTLAPLTSNLGTDSTELMWQETSSRLQAGIAPEDGDRQTDTIYLLASNALNYRLMTQSVTKSQQVSGSLVMYAKTAHTFDSNDTVPVTDEVWTDNVDGDRAITRRAYDMTTGNVTQRWKPVQSVDDGGDGAYASYTYDARQLFVAEEVSEPGGYYHTSEVTDYKYDYGTGTKIETTGPNSLSCQNNSSCPSGDLGREDHRIQVDGLGRTVARWETVANPGATYYQDFEVETFGYVDADPSSVTHQSAIDYNPSTLAVRYTQDKTDLDGHGRPVKHTVYALGSAPADQVTTYVYNTVDGTLKSVSTPDPSVNDGSTVTYTYSFDTLGRPTAMRRPDASSPSGQSGVNLSYDGLTTTTTEVVGDAGGTPASTTTTDDAFGRLANVTEATSGSPATWTYTYGPDDQVVSIVDPESKITAISYDFAGRETKITRNGNSWTYGYDKNGNRISETFPGSSGAGDDINYINSYAYDDLDEVTSKVIGARSLSASDVTLFGAGALRYFWGLGTNGVGRLAEVASYAPGSNTQVVNLQYARDAQGRGSQVYEQFAMLPSQYRLLLTTDNLAGQQQYTYYHDYPTQSAATTATFQYDNRGLASSVQLSLSSTSPTQTIGVQTRNVAGLVTSRRTNVTGSPLSYIESDWTYDKLGRVASQTVQDSVSGTVGQVARQDLTYFGNDDPASLDHWLGATNHKHFVFSYDQRHELATVGETQLPDAFDATYTYGAAGRFSTASENAAALPNSNVQNRDVTYEYNGTDPEEVTALVSGGNTVWAYQYDAAGNETMRCSAQITSGVCPSTADEMDYVYDGEDQLRRATHKVNGVVQGIEEYWYANGTRTNIVKRDGAGDILEYIWFIGDVEAHYDGSGNWTHSYAYVSMGTPVARVDTNTSLAGKVEFEFHGLANNTLAAVDEATGTINTSFDYTPFGEIIEATDAGSTNNEGVAAHRRRMNDKYVDDLTGLAYYGARYYDNVSMTWTQGDPYYRFAPDEAWTSPRKANLYTDDLNNPLRYLDPDGRGAGAIFADAFNLTAQAIEDVGKVAVAVAEPAGTAVVAVEAAPVVALVGVTVALTDPAAPGCGGTCPDRAWNNAMGYNPFDLGQTPDLSALNPEAGVDQTTTRTSNSVHDDAGSIGPNGGGRPADHQQIVDERMQKRAERRYDKSRKAAGQQPGSGGPHNQNKKQKKGPRGERGRDRRRRAQEQDQQREKNVGIDEEHSRKQKGPNNNMPQ